MNEGMPREASATHWASQRGKGSRHGEDAMFSESKGGTLWRSRKAGNGAGQLILHRGTRSRKGRRCRGLWAGLQLGCGCLSGTQMALLVVGDESGSLGWRLSTWGLLSGLCSRKGAGHYEDGTMALLRSQWPSQMKVSSHQSGEMIPTLSKLLLDRGRKRVTPYYGGRAAPSGRVCLSPHPSCLYPQTNCTHRPLPPCQEYQS